MCLICLNCSHLLNSDQIHFILFVMFRYTIMEPQPKCSHTGSWCQNCEVTSLLDHICIPNTHKGERALFQILHSKCLYFLDNFL